ncbi:helix-turn-helix transcriptional regulator [Cytobacillus purgationiresistens]|uniref:ArsR family transcriptional regulator n=1 Tax=Cytobacillus purgationiresistens TaxID=863449 RepID=A0ABU0ADV4_9BACI|nr:helix-turn-helix domain-containing protein [Cytobacillus purgationiresistens]MDQ0269429.1 putative ArsR family transcriptional regulator [Cytobacillus purgationiresistens]
MEETLKITNTLADPTRYYIYQFISNKHGTVSVQEIADLFTIHPNVARLHLSKLEDVNMIISETIKTGKGGRPSRQYRMSDTVIQLHFPYRNYQLLSDIALETMVSLGVEGQKALYITGKRYGERLMDEQKVKEGYMNEEQSFDHRVTMIIQAAQMSGLQPEFEVEGEKILFQMFNCPFKETAKNHQETVCQMHFEFLRGMFESVFNNIELRELGNMLNGCSSCSYEATYAK